MVEESDNKLVFSPSIISGSSRCYGKKQVDSDGEKGCFVSVREGLIDEVMFEQRPE